MKKYLLAIFMSICVLGASAQEPTLSVGLETLTMNKGQIDVAALTELIMEKQRELKNEALKRFMFKFFPQSNYTTKYYVQNCLNILLNETNPQVIEKEILELTTNYALAMGVASVIYSDKTQSNDLISLSARYRKEMEVFQPVRAKKPRHERKRDELLEAVEDLGAKAEKEPNAQTKRELKAKNDALRLYEIRNGLLQAPINQPEENSIDFGLVLDLTSAALSNIEDLKTKGFFKKNIDYRRDDFYLRLANKDLKKSLDNSQKVIQQNVEPYIKSYDVIKEFYSRFKDRKLKQGETIKGVLSAEYVKAVTSEYGTSSILNLLSTKGSPITLAQNTKDQIAVIKELQSDLAESEIIDQYLNALLTNPVNDLIKIRDSLTRLQTADSKKLIKEIEQNKKILSDNQMQFEVESLDLIDQVDAIIKPNKDNSLPEIETYLPRIEYGKTNEDSIVRNTIFNLKSGFQRLSNTAERLRDLEIRIADQKNYFKSAVSNLQSYSSIVKPNKFLNLLTPENISSYEGDIRSAFEANKGIKDSLEKVRVIMTDDLVKNNDFLNAYFLALLSNFALPEMFSIKMTEPKEFEHKSLSHYTDSLAKAYTILSDISRKESITLKEINYLDDHVIPFFINHSVLHLNRSPDSNLTIRIKEFQLLSNLLKIKAVSNVNLSRYDTSYMKVFGFISNLGNLDKAKTYQQMLDLFQYSNNYVAENLPNGKFKNSYDLISNSVKKYTLINTQDQYVNLDVSSFLSEMQRYYDRRNTSRFSLYLSLGLNQAFLVDPIPVDADDPSNNESIKNIGFASEKLGIRYRIKRFHTAKGYENVTRGDLQLDSNSPFFNDCFVALYGSGLLYSIANTTTNSNFDYPQIGLTAGLRFYNALDLNFFYAVPIIDGERALSNGLFGIALDIPLGEYLEKVGKRR